MCIVQQGDVFSTSLRDVYTEHRALAPRLDRPRALLAGHSSLPRCGARLCRSDKPTRWPDDDRPAGTMALMVFVGAARRGGSSSF